MPNFVITSTSIPFSNIFLLRDSWEEFKYSDVPTYFEDGFKIFLKRLKEFKNLERPLTFAEEQELEFMLSSLIHAKNTWNEKNNPKT